ncbi:MAG TPA: hypothetical protein QGF95_06920 [Candidatus Latescibacteria bacterium]|jgi:nitrate reductase NapAB chaperone NapD|nr:hypothetical protein [Gemmatimonadaceae bacterium]MDP6017357.1 hypothetical protein [Candidatus Latescibacterota bacterium]HJP30270.1 hypothetical protein [Candidatus Latescibacterota bacterium]|tara:strand:+ start:82 stop:360 length:279 start_codon:yes stop_codon:yes gene_type:complete
MPVCSYLVFPQPDAEGLAARLAALPGCETMPADNADLLILVTDTPDPEAEEELQDKLQNVPGIQCMVLTFGDIDETEQGHEQLEDAMERRRK